MIFTSGILSVASSDDDKKAVPSRINHPVAVYQDEHEFNIYAIDPATGKGFNALRISDDLSANMNGTLLGEAENPFTGALIRVDLLSTGNFQVTTLDANNAPYVIQWDESGRLLKP